MKGKHIAILSVLVVVIGGIITVSITGLPSLGLSFLDGVREKAHRDDLVIPVTATGTIEASQLIQIKSKASGVVDEIPVREGMMVEVGDILVKLDPVDEKRIVEARQADLNRSKSAWKKSKIALAKTKVDLPLQSQLAQARLDDAAARLVDAKYRFDELKRREKTGAASAQELITSEATYKAAKAARDIAQYDLERASNDEVVLLDSAKEDVAQADAAVSASQKNFEDASQRLEETVVRSRCDAMVYKIQVRQGETIQSGMSTFTGTPLMMLADVDSMFVMAQVDEADIGAIRDIAPRYARPGETQRLDEEEYIRRAREIIEDAARRAGIGETEGQEDPGDRADDKPQPDADAASPPSAEAIVVAAELMGRPVEVTVEAYRSQTYKGVIERILPEPKRLSGAVSFDVRIRLLGDDLQKLLGMQADLSFETKTRKDAILVKNEALSSEGRLCYVYIPYRDSESARWDEKKVEVKIGATDGTFTEIISGIEADQEVWIKRPRKTHREREESED